MLQGKQPRMFSNICTLNNTPEIISRAINQLDACVIASTATSQRDTVNVLSALNAQLPTTFSQATWITASSARRYFIMCRWCFCINTLHGRSAGNACGIRHQDMVNNCNNSESRERSYSNPYLHASQGLWWLYRPSNYQRKTKRRFLDTRDTECGWGWLEKECQISIKIILL